MAVAARAYSSRDVAVLVACCVLSLVAQGLPERLRAPIAATLRRSVVAPLVALQRDAELSRQAWISRGQEVVKRDSVVLRSLALESMQTENDRLRRLLGLGAQLKWGFVPAEVLHGRSTTEEQTAILSAGSRSGVVPFSPVVAPEGVVGMVRTVDPGMSIAILWTHPDFRVSAIAADGTGFGIVGAHLGNGPERYLLELRGVAARNTIKPGTTILTSGLGGVFPRGIPIGTVLGEVKTTELWARTYLLRPTTLPADLGAVMVLLPPRSSAGVANVWASGGADSATKRVVTAGDSLARAAAAARDSALRALSNRDSLRMLVPLDTAAARVRRDTTRRIITGRDSTGAPVYRRRPADSSTVPVVPARPRRRDTTARADSAVKRP
ncbi:MAG: rod shape-determining protein MreC [Gemmatimonadota bacterium]|nr:rod shape-determining protein MreC [Gemmatimonadota bacterium]